MKRPGVRDPEAFDDGEGEEHHWDDEGELRGEFVIEGQGRLNRDGVRVLYDDRVLDVRGLLQGDEVLVQCGPPGRDGWVRRVHVERGRPNGDATDVERAGHESSETERIRADEGERRGRPRADGVAPDFVKRVVDRPRREGQ